MTWPYWNVNNLNMFLRHQGKFEFSQIYHLMIHAISISFMFVLYNGASRYLFSIMKSDNGLHAKVSSLINNYKKCMDIYHNSYISSSEIWMLYHNGYISLHAKF